MGMFRSTPFWRIAKRMLRDKTRLILAVVFAVVSASGLAVGLGGVVVVLEQVLGDPTQPDYRTLVDQAQALSDKMQSTVGVGLPSEWINTLPTDQYHAVLVVLIVLGVLTLIGSAANFMHLYMSEGLTLRTLAGIRRDAFERVMAQPLGTVVREGSSDTISRILTDSGVLSIGLSALMSRALANITKGVAAIVMAFLINWRLSAITLIAAPVLFVIIRKLGKAIRRASKGAMVSRGKLMRTASETLSGFRVVKVYGYEREALKRFDQHNNAVLRDMLRVRFARSISSPVMEMVSLIVVGGLALIAAKQIITGDLSPGEFIGTLAALAIAGNALKPMNAVVQNIQQAEAAAERLEKLLTTVGEGHAGGVAIARLTKGIRLTDITLRYPGTTDATAAALNGVSLSIEHGSRVAFVGPNGSGKTTLLSLLPRLYEPTSGTIEFDGVDTQRADLRSLRDQIGVVTQEVVLFEGTLADNIAFGKHGVSDQDIIDAAERAHAMSFIDKLPEGLNTIVGEQGLTLSGGQRQRLSIARALLRDPAILIMDEATSMVDAESEAQIAQAIADFGEGRTVLIVAHRLSTVVNADKIVVLDQGKIVGEGTHDELLTSCEVYQRLAAHQFAPSETTS